MPRAGKIVLLCGPSSAGKSTLAHAVRARRERVAVVSVDQLYKSLAPPVDRPAYVALVGAACAAAGALASAGYDALLDVVLAWPECVEAVRAATHVVVLRAPVEDLEERERVRGDRRIGLAREQLGRVEHDVRPDRVLDGTAPLEESVARVVALLDGS